VIVKWTCYITICLLMNTVVGCKKKENPQPGVVVINTQAEVFPGLTDAGVHAEPGEVITWQPGGEPFTIHFTGKNPCEKGDPASDGKNPATCTIKQNAHGEYNYDVWPQKRMGTPGQYVGPFVVGTCKACRYFEKDPHFADPLPPRHGITLQCGDNGTVTPSAPSHPPVLKGDVISWRLGGDLPPQGTLPFVVSNLAKLCSGATLPINTNGGFCTVTADPGKVDYKYEDVYGCLGKSGTPTIKVEAP